MGPMGCAVHFLEYSADRVACIRFDVASGGLRISLASVLSQTFPFSVFRFPFSGAKVRHSRYSGTQNDAAPYSFARSRRCWHERVAEYSVFCTVREGVPQENTAVSRKYMQSVTEIMQIDEADSIVGCKGVRLICIRLVETNLTPLR